MKDLDSVIALWRENRDIEAVIAADIFGDPDAIRTVLDKKTESERLLVTDALADMMTALSLYIEETDKEQKAILAQLSVTEKSAQACLSYGLRDAHVKSREDINTEE